MIRRWVDQILYRLGIKKRDERPAIEQIAEILPYAFAISMIIGIINTLPRPIFPWYWRLFYWTFRKVRRFRSVVIGY